MTSMPVTFGSMFYIIVGRSRAYFQTLQNIASGKGTGQSAVEMYYAVLKNLCRAVS